MKAPVLVQTTAAGCSVEARPSLLINVELWGRSGSDSKDVCVLDACVFQGLGPEMIVAVTLSNGKHTPKDSWLLR